MASHSHRWKNDKKSTGDHARGPHHLTYQELMDRKSRGLCFRCVEYYTSVSKSLRLLILEDGETMDEHGEISAIEGDERKETEVFDCNMVSLMVSPMVSLVNNTMSLHGLIGDVPIAILIDSGASHNFISPYVISALGLSCDYHRKFLVRLGDGHQISTVGKCEAFPLQLAEITFSTEAHILELGGVDLILGLSWLRSLGKVLMDWQVMTMSFLWDGKQVQLQALKSQGTKLLNGANVSLHSTSQFSIISNSHWIVEGCLWNLQLGMSIAQGS